MFNRARLSVALLLLLVSALPAAVQAGTTAIYFDSQPGDPVGQSAATVSAIPTVGGYVTSTGLDCGDGGRTDCDESFELESEISLQATASAGYQFFGWGGICSGGNPILLITVTTAGRCLAVFHPLADAPSHPFGHEFLMLEGSGVTPSRSVWLPPESTMQVSGTGSLGSPLTFVARTALGRVGSVAFRIPSGHIVAGEYDAGDATGNRVDGFCLTSHGFFKVYEAEYNPDGSLASFAADFEGYCSAFGPPYVVGAIRYRSSRNVVIPFEGAYPVNRKRLSVAPSLFGKVVAPGIDCGATANDCVESYADAAVHSIQAIPSAGYAFVGWNGDCSGGSYIQRLIDRSISCEPIFRATGPGLPQDPRLASGSLTIQSQEGDPIGAGIYRTSVHPLPLWSLGTSNFGRMLSVVVFGSGLEFQFRAADAGVLGVGSYDEAVGIWGSSESPGLYVYNFGRFCSSEATRGRFVIHELRLGDPRSSFPVEALALDFEVQCNNGPPLRGSIRYRSSRPVIQPFAYEVGPPFARFDFTGDESPDFVWQNRNDGRMLLWHVSGVTYTFNEPSSIPQITDPNWHIVGTADADLDGYNDLYWQHQTTGELAIWYMRGTQVVRTDLVTQVVADTNWQVRTVFDVDGDGQPDLLWQHRVSGHIAVWYMNDGAFRSSQLVGPGQIADPAWTIVGAGDANGDGRADLYWQHPTTGQLALWYMDGVRLLSTTLLTPSSVSDTNWQVRGVADLNHDGSPDIVWQNVSTSDVAVWMLNGSRFVESRLINGPKMPAAEWVLVGPR